MLIEQLTGRARHFVNRLVRYARWQSTSIDSLSVFYPASANYDRYPELALQGANNFPSQLLRVSGVPRVEEISAFDLGTDGRVLSRLRSSFRSSGCSKSDGLTTLYAAVLTNLTGKPDLAILEFGIGTNNPKLVSTMGGDYSPGASLQGFAGFDPRVNVVGVDIDVNVLFQADRIRTYQADQLSTDSLQALNKDLSTSEFDLIIDDGLHSPEANLNTLEFALNRVTPRGVVIIEDIPSRASSVWHLVGYFLDRQGFASRLIRVDADGLAFVTSRALDSRLRLPG
jgi:hypothetical protein